jgi:hypothetical protein
VLGASDRVAVVAEAFALTRLRDGLRALRRDIEGVLAHEPELLAQRLDRLFEPFK